jgi:hypothetical protein
LRWLRALWISFRFMIAQAKSHCNRIRSAGGEPGSPERADFARFGVAGRRARVWSAGVSPAVAAASCRRFSEIYHLRGCPILRRFCEGWVFLRHHHALAFHDAPFAVLTSKFKTRNSKLLSSPPPTDQKRKILDRNDLRPRYVISVFENKRLKPSVYLPCGLTLIWV